MDYKENVIALLSNQELSKEQKEKLENIFPELKESEDEDERIRKALVEYFGEQCDMSDWNGVYGYQVLAWIEKQVEQQGKSALEAWKDMRLEVYQQASGNRHEPNYSDDSTKMFSLNDIDEIIEKISEQSHNDKVEPKFKVGDWIVTDDSYGKIVRHVDEIKSIDKKYIVSDENGIIYNISFSTEHKWHKWAIEDASAGDVLYLKHDGVEHIIIYKRLVKKNFHTILSVHCAYDGSTNDFFEDVDSYHCITSWRDEKEIHPATKEQRDLLFASMKEAGYEWDAEKKELRKIKSKMLDADKVIEWLKSYSVIDNNIIDCFKKDFGL